MSFIYIHRSYCSFACSSCVVNYYYYYYDDETTTPTGISVDSTSVKCSYCNLILLRTLNLPQKRKWHLKVQSYRVLSWTYRNYLSVIRKHIITKGTPLSFFSVFFLRASLTVIWHQAVHEIQTHRDLWFSLFLLIWNLLEVLNVPASSGGKTTSKLSQKWADFPICLHITVVKTMNHHLLPINNTELRNSWNFFKSHQLLCACCFQKQWHIMKVNRWQKC